METIQIVLTSTFIAGIVSTIISYIVSIRLKKLDFKNEYYKEILKKRLAAYQYIEAQLAILKTVVLDENDQKPYHIIFSYGEAKFLEYQQNIIMAMSYSLWIDKETTNTLERVNEIFYNLNIKAANISDEELIELGKKYYQAVSDLRFELENTTKKGLYNLHDIKKAFKTKKHNSERTIRELK